MKTKHLLLPLAVALIAGCAKEKPQAVQPTDTTQTQAQPATPPVAEPVAEKAKPKDITIDGVEGFQDTPLQPGLLWHVHDPARPQPPIVTPGTFFSDNAAPPSDAIVLFDGSNLNQWRDKKTGEAAPWTVANGVATSAKNDIVTTNQFGDLQLHLEFREPAPPKGSGQGRGNSGVFLMGRYEIQVLDCYDNKTYADGSTGAVYAQHPPLVNACRKPGDWQTYDIIFNVPHFDTDGRLITPGYATVFHNGVVVQNHQAIRGDTNWRSVGEYKSHDSTGPLALQFHGNAVAFRNIWVRPVAVVNDP